MRPIDADEVIKKRYSIIARHYHVISDDWQVVDVEDILNAPTITDKEVIAEFLKQGTFKIHIPEAEPFPEPVKRGKWEPHPSEREWDICSYCHLGTKRREYGLNDDGTEWVTEQSYTYCPWCGALMENNDG